MSKIMWKVDKYSLTPTPVEVVNETPAFVAVRTKALFSERLIERREKKVSDYSSYFPTWAEARSAILDRQRESLQQAEKALDAAKKCLAQAEALPTTEPTKD